MKRIFGLSAAALFCATVWLPTSLNANDKKEGGGSFSQASEDSRYLKGAVPEKDGKVVFSKVFELPGASQQLIFDAVQQWQKKQAQSDSDLSLKSSVLQNDSQTGVYQLYNTEYLVFVDRGLSLDRSEFSYALTFRSTAGQCEMEVSRLRYSYEKETHTAENWISDAVALDKSGSKIYPGMRRVRIKTIDRVDALTAGLENALRDMQLARYTRTEKEQQTATTPDPSAPVVIAAPTPNIVAPNTPQNVSPAPTPSPREEPTAETPLNTEYPAETPRLPVTPVMPVQQFAYRNITPQQIVGNIFRLMENNLLILTVEEKKTIVDQVGMGLRDGKPVLLVEVAAAWTGGQKEGETFRVAFCNKSDRERIEQELNRPSSAAASAVTPHIPHPTSGWMILECKRTNLIPLEKQSASATEKAYDNLLIGEITQVFVH